MRALLFLALASLVGCGDRMPGGTPIEIETTLDVPYGDADAHRLDLYRPLVSAPVPLVIWVHGGAWLLGDKANLVDAKLALFTTLGWAFASINYRLSPNPPNGEPTRIMHPAHVHDVTRAVHCLHAHAAELGVDPARIAVLGHSAGAHLAALVSTDRRLFAAYGLTHDVIRCTGSFDTEAYDIPAALAVAGPEQRAILENAFTSDRSVQLDASPRHFVSDARSPRFLVAVRGAEHRRIMQLDFVHALQLVGAEAAHLDATGLTHEEVNTGIGTDDVMTPPIIEFLTSCFE